MESKNSNTLRNTALALLFPIVLIFAAGLYSISAGITVDRGLYAVTDFLLEIGFFTATVLYDVISFFGWIIINTMVFLAIELFDWGITSLNAYNLEILMLGIAVDVLLTVIHKQIIIRFTYVGLCLCAAVGLGLMLWREVIRYMSFPAITTIVVAVLILLYLAFLIINALGKRRLAREKAELEAQKKRDEEAAEALRQQQQQEEARKQAQAEKARIELERWEKAQAEWKQQQQAEEELRRQKKAEKDAAKAEADRKAKEKKARDDAEKERLKREKKARDDAEKKAREEREKAERAHAEKFRTEPDIGELLRRAKANPAFMHASAAAQRRVLKPYAEDLIKQGLTTRSLDALIDAAMKHLIKEAA